MFFTILKLIIQYKKLKKKKSLNRQVLQLLVVPLVIFFSFLFVFFSVDDFWLYARLLVLDRDIIQNSGDGLIYSNFTDTGGSPSTDNSSTTAGGCTGFGGLNTILMNSMAGGYCADWLTIVRDHCNRKYLCDDIDYPHDVAPSIVLLIGTAMKETDCQIITLPDGTKAKVPKSTLDLSKATYGSNIDGCDYTLYQVSSQFFKNHLSYISKPFGSNMRSVGGYCGPFQLSPDMLSVTPSNPSGTGKGGSYSKLVGYGMPQDRNTSNSDHAFFPDSVTQTIKSTWGRWVTASSLLGTADINFEGEATAGLGYIAHNAGEANVAYWFGLGTYSGSRRVSSACNETYKDSAKGPCVADAMNQITAACKQILDYVAKHPTALDESLYLDRKTFEGIAMGSVLYGCHNAFVTSTNKSRLISQMNNASFKTGMTLAYRAVTGNESTTEDEILSMIQSLDTSVGDSRRANTGAYGLVDNKKDQYPNAKYVADGVCIHFEDLTHTFTYNGQTYPVCHAADMEPTSGLFWVPLGGAFMYWKMLTYSGVECTFAEALGDVSNTNAGESENGNLISDIPATSTANGSSGTAIATCMARICYPTMDQGKNEYRAAFRAKRGRERYSGADPGGIECGSEIYLQVRAFVLKEDEGYYASCDRGVCTAVRWAGADDNFPRGGCKAILTYFVNGIKSSNSRWVEVDWGGDVSKLQPGDIFIRSDAYEREHGHNVTGNTGHIICYVGDTIARQVHPTSTTKTTVGHASYNDRPPCLGDFYSNIKTFRVFRNVRPMETSKYSGFNPST